MTELEEKEKGVIYKILHNDKIIYIGSSTNLKYRICAHKVFCYNQYKNNKYTYNLKLYKYIRDNAINFDTELRFEVIEEVCKKDLKKVEGKYIRTYKDSILNHRVECRSMKEYHQDHAEEIKEYMREWHIRIYPQTREKQLAYKKEYYQKNKERIIERQKNYYIQHKEERAEYYQQNKEKLETYQKEYQKEYRERKKGGKENTSCLTSLAGKN